MEPSLRIASGISLAVAASLALRTTAGRTPPAAEPPARKPRRRKRRNTGLTR